MMIDMNALLQHRLEIDTELHIVCVCGGFHESFTGPITEETVPPPEQGWSEYVNHVAAVSMDKKVRLN